jgi:tetratricopeptide (TPR) repeat protein
MKLTAELNRQLNDPTLEPEEQARRQIEAAKKFEEAGDYEASREVLAHLWQGVGERPRLKNLSDLSVVGEVLLRVGALSGWIGSSEQIEGSQERAKDLLSESVALFEQLGDISRAAEGQTELAYCYWREGAFDEARVILKQVLGRLGDDQSERRAVAILRSAIVEASANRHNDALNILTKAAPLFEAATHAIKGKFHNELASVLNYLSTAERRMDYSDRALVEYAAAGFHFEQARHTRNQAAVENNLGLLFASLGKFADAHTHLGRARRLFVRLRDSVHTAQVQETSARAFIAEGRYVEAEKVARLAVGVLGKGGEVALLAEALTTHGIALARLGRNVPARAAFLRAEEVSRSNDDVESAGLASLALIEELGDELSLEEARAIYQRADGLLARAQHPDVLIRLRRAAAKLLAEDRERTESEESKPSTASARKKEGGHPADPESIKETWEGFSLKDEVRRLEERYIRQALSESEGRVSQAAKLLGFDDHGSLNSLLKNKHPHLRAARLPPAPRKRSLIRR